MMAWLYDGNAKQSEKQLILDISEISPSDDTSLPPLGLINGTSLAPQENLDSWSVNSNEVSDDSGYSSNLSINNNPEYVCCLPPSQSHISSDLSDNKNIIRPAFLPVQPLLMVTEKRLDDSPESETFVTPFNTSPCTEEFFDIENAPFITPSNSESNTLSGAESISTPSFEPISSKIDFLQIKLQERLNQLIFYAKPEEENSLFCENHMKNISKENVDISDGLKNSELSDRIITAPNMKEINLPNFENVISYETENKNNEDDHIVPKVFHGDSSTCLVEDRDGNSYETANNYPENPLNFNDDIIDFNKDNLHESDILGNSLIENYLFELDNTEIDLKHSLDSPNSSFKNNEKVYDVLPLKPCDDFFPILSESPKCVERDRNDYNIEQNSKSILSDNFEENTAISNNQENIQYMRLSNNPTHNIQSTVNTTAHTCTNDLNLANQYATGELCCGNSLREPLIDQSTFNGFSCGIDNDSEDRIIDCFDELKGNEYIINRQINYTEPNENTLYNESSYFYPRNISDSSPIIHHSANTTKGTDSNADISILQNYDIDNFNEKSLMEFNETSNHKPDTNIIYANVESDIFCLDKNIVTNLSNNGGMEYSESELLDHTKESEIYNKLDGVQHDFKHYNYITNNESVAKNLQTITDNETNEHKTYHVYSTNEDSKNSDSQVHEIVDNRTHNINLTDDILSKFSDQTFENQPHGLEGTENDTRSLSTGFNLSSKSHNDKPLDYENKPKSSEYSHKQKNTKNENDPFIDSQPPRSPFMKREDSSLSAETKKIVMALLDKSKKEVYKPPIGVQDKMKMLMNKSKEAKPIYSKYSPSFVSSMIRNNKTENSKPEYSLPLRPSSKYLNNSISKGSKSRKSFKSNIKIQKDHSNPIGNTDLLNKEHKSVHKIDFNNAKQDSKEVLKIKTDVKIKEKKSINDPMKQKGTAGNENKIINPNYKDFSKSKINLDRKFTSENSIPLSKQLLRTHINSLNKVSPMMFDKSLHIADEGQTKNIGRRFSLIPKTDDAIIKAEFHEKTTSDALIQESVLDISPDIPSQSASQQMFFNHKTIIPEDLPNNKSISLVQTSQNQNHIHAKDKEIDSSTLNINLSESVISCSSNKQSPEERHATIAKDSTESDLMNQGEILSDQAKDCIYKNNELQNNGNSIEAPSEPEIDCFENYDRSELYYHSPDNKDYINNEYDNTSETTVDISTKQYEIKEDRNEEDCNGELSSDITTKENNHMLNFNGNSQDRATSFDMSNSNNQINSGKHSTEEFPKELLRNCIEEAISRRGSNEVYNSVMNEINEAIIFDDIKNSTNNELFSLRKSDINTVLEKLPFASPKIRSRINSTGSCTPSQPGSRRGSQGFINTSSHNNKKCAIECLSKFASPKIKSRLNSTGSCTSSQPGSRRASQGTIDISSHNYIRKCVTEGLSRYESLENQINAEDGLNLAKPFKDEHDVNDPGNKINIQEIPSCKNEIDIKPQKRPNTSEEPVKCNKGMKIDQSEALIKEHLINNLSKQNSLDSEEGSFSENIQKSLIRSVVSKNAEKTREALKNGANPNAWCGNNPAIVRAARDGMLYIVQALVAAGANLNAQSEVGNSAVHVAARAGHAEIALYLVECGADIDSINKYGVTPLQLALAYGKPQIARTLIYNNADVDLPNCVGTTAEDLITDLDYIGLMPDFLEVDDGEEGIEVEFAPLNDEVPPKVRLIQAVEERRIEIVEKLLDEGVSPDTAVPVAMHWPAGATILHRAAHHGWDIVTKILLMAKAHVNSRDVMGNTPLHAAAQAGHNRVIKVLLDAGADIEAESVTKRTPLHSAASKGNELTVNVLLKRGANANATDAEGRTPSDWAVKRGHKSLARKIKQQRRRNSLTREVERDTEIRKSHHLYKVAIENQ